MDAAPIHDLGKPGQFGYVADRNACILDCLRRAAGRNQLDARFGKGCGEIGKAGLVGHRQQRTPYRHEIRRGDLFRGYGHAGEAFQLQTGMARAVAQAGRKSSRTGLAINLQPFGG